MNRPRNLINQCLLNRNRGTSGRGSEDRKTQEKYEESLFVIIPVIRIIRIIFKRFDTVANLSDRPLHFDFKFLE